jgi:hypothetical protein
MSEKTGFFDIALGVPGEGTDYRKTPLYQSLAARGIITDEETPSFEKLAETYDRYNAVVRELPALTKLALKEGQSKRSGWLSRMFQTAGEKKALENLQIIRGSESFLDLGLAWRNLKHKASMTPDKPFHIAVARPLLMERNRVGARLVTIRDSLEVLRGNKAYPDPLEWNAQPLSL